MAKIFLEISWVQSLLYKTARTISGLTVKQLAAMAHTSHSTIVKLEAGYEIKPATVRAIREVLEAHNVKFIPHDTYGEWAEPTVPQELPNEQ